MLIRPSVAHSYKHFILCIAAVSPRGVLLRWPRDTLYQLKLALISPTSGGRSVGIVRWRTKPPNDDNTYLIWSSKNDTEIVKS
jgi:hypothetical protein